VPAGSLGFWQSRLKGSGTATYDATDARGLQALSFADPSGLMIRLMETEADERAPWTGGGIGVEAAIRGLDRVTMTLGDAAPTLALLTSVLGFEVVNETGSRTLLAVREDMAGRRIELLQDTSAPPAQNGLGTVHHVAMAIATAEEQIDLRQELIALGYSVTEVLDRQYFQSIYFRESGGILLEVATIQPGFTVDEPPAGLGRELKLPPWEEPNRREIEQRLPAVS
jgi:glyoxalase family protein